MTVITSCMDDNDNSSSIDNYLHRELANDFVANLNLDPEFEVEVIKANTKVQNYVVIYDPYTDSYDAINLGNYDPQLDNATDYYFNSIDSNFFDLDVNPGYYDEYMSGGTVYSDWISQSYRDRTSGLVFEKTSATPKDLAKVAALKEVAVINKKANFLSSEFGLSLNRGKEVARLVNYWKKASKKGMTDNEYNAFSTELLGFSITAGKVALKAALTGDNQALDVLVQNAAETNSISPEHASKLMTKVFGL